MRPTELLATMTDAEKAAALRFCETAEDDGSYDTSKAMLKRLSALGLIKHAGGGYYEQQDALLAIRDELDAWFEDGCRRGAAAAKEVIAAGGSLDALDYDDSEHPGYNDGFFTTLSSERMNRSALTA